MQNGVLVKLKEVPLKVRLFKLIATDGNIDWLITNCPDETLTVQVAQDACSHRRPRCFSQSLDALRGALALFVHYWNARQLKRCEHPRYHHALFAPLLLQV